MKQNNAFPTRERKHFRLLSCIHSLVKKTSLQSQNQFPENTLAIFLRTGLSSNFYPSPGPRNSSFQNRTSKNVIVHTPCKPHVWIKKPAMRTGKNLKQKSFHQGTMHERHSDHVSRQKNPPLLRHPSRVPFSFLIINYSGIWDGAPDALFNLLQHPSLIHTSVPKCPFFVGTSFLDSHKACTEFVIVRCFTFCKCKLIVKNMSLNFCVIQ